MLSPQRISPLTPKVLKTKPKLTPSVAAMRVLKFDSGERFDDPNAYWGGPSYGLEPGDLGYQEPPSATLPSPRQANLNPKIKCQNQTTSNVGIPTSPLSFRPLS